MFVLTQKCTSSTFHKHSVEGQNIKDLVLLLVRGLLLLLLQVTFVVSNTECLGGGKWLLWCLSNTECLSGGKWLLYTVAFGGLDLGV